jgi:hypothetical protein
VLRFLNERHPRKYHIFNVSERTYDKSRFEDRVSNYNWPDHHAPPFNLLFELVDEMYKWLKGKCLLSKTLTQLIPKMLWSFTVIQVREGQELPAQVCFSTLDFSRTFRIAPGCSECRGSLTVRG